MEQTWEDNEYRAIRTWSRERRKGRTKPKQVMRINVADMQAEARYKEIHILLF